MHTELESFPLNDQEYFSDTKITIGKEHPRQFRILTGTVAGSREKPNEDAFAIYPYSETLELAVFDGTTSLKQIPALREETGAHFASHFLRDNFRGIPRPATPSNLLKKLNRNLLKTSEELGGKVEDTHTLPASTGTIISINANTNSVNFAHVGDSYFVVYYSDGTSTRITDDRNKRFDEGIFELIRAIAQKRGITPREARYTPELMQALIEMFIRRNNNPSGTGIGLINGDPMMEQYIQDDTISLDGISGVLLGTDGLVPVGWSIEKETDRQRMREAILEGGIKQLVQIKHEREDADPDWHHVRHKHSDDATGIYLELG